MVIKAFILVYFVSSSNGVASSPIQGLNGNAVFKTLEECEQAADLVDSQSSSRVSPQCMAVLE